MSKVNRLIALLLTLALTLPLTTAATAATTPTVPTVSAKSAILMEADSGEIVYEKAADLRLPMASTTKMMTALTALSLAAPDTPIEADARAVGTEGSSIYLVEGETLALEALLYALLLESANDAAAAIAFGLCGSIEAFAEQMNTLALELGLTNTHFANPHGLDDEEHYSTARELAIIARAVLKNDLLATIVSTRKSVIPHGDGTGKRLLINHNKLLRTYEGCIGVKTGFTKRSGRCLVSAAERDGVRLIAVTLNAPDDWNDHTAMLNYGFTQYRSVSLCTEGSFDFTLPLVGGTADSVRVCNVDALRITMPVGQAPVEATVEIARFVYAPVCTGDVLGWAVWRADRNGDGVREEIGRVALIACQTVSKKKSQKSPFGRLKALISRLFSKKKDEVR